MHNARQCILRSAHGESFFKGFWSMSKEKYKLFQAGSVHVCHWAHTLPHTLGQKPTIAKQLSTQLSAGFSSISEISIKGGNNNYHR